MYIQTTDQTGGPGMCTCSGTNRNRVGACTTTAALSPAVRDHRARYNITPSRPTHEPRTDYGAVFLHPTRTGGATSRHSRPTAGERQDRSPSCQPERTGSGVGRQTRSVTLLGRKGLATLCVQRAQCRTRSSEITFLRSLKIVQLIGNTRTESHYDSTQKRNLGRTCPRLRTLYA